MAKRIIDYEQLIKNYETMIDTLEYDSMRSGGKAKLNAPVLANMHDLKDRYTARLAKPVTKTAPKKGGN
jgi:hypothetical protein